MRTILLILLSLTLNNLALADSWYAELTEMFDDKMRGKDNQWVRPHPGPFVWDMIENKKGKYNWRDADEYVVYAQDHNQIIIATDANSSNLTNVELK